MQNILEKIIAFKHKEVEDALRERPLRDVMKQADKSKAPLDFLEALSKSPPIRLIAEVKKASPSKGIIREDFDPVKIAQAYQAGGASCLSILTDREFFKGSLDYLTSVRHHVDLPLLRKDFVIHPYQVFEARAAGADAVLLIAECLSRQELKSLHELTLDLGMVALVELYDQKNVDNALATGTKLIGINNRNLANFQVDLQHTIRLRCCLPQSCVVVGESGISSRSDAMLLEENGIQAMLVGESLMRQTDITAATKQLLGLDSSQCH
jgi:indole-3-glycerol phosphate synthase